MKYTFTNPYDFLYKLDHRFMNYYWEKNSAVKITNKFQMSFTTGTIELIQNGQSVFKQSFAEGSQEYFYIEEILLKINESDSDLEYLHLKAADTQRLKDNSQLIINYHFKPI